MTRSPATVALERRCLAWMCVLCVALAAAILHPELAALLFPNL